MTNTEQELEFELQSNVISECVDEESWQLDGVITLSDDEVAEITAGDDKPFYVEFVGLYEGMSNNKRQYNSDAVRSCADAMVGVNMYKGHVEPGTQGWKYREPVGRVVSAKLDTINIDGQEVLAAMGKAYITESDTKLRTDIRKKMAGSVSILGNARMVRQLGETIKTVTHLHKPLKSVDFCNPGTGGLSQAGVTAVVSEMGVKTTEALTENQDEDIKMTTSSRLNKEELLAEYRPEITALVGEQVEEQVSEMAQQRRDLASQREGFADEKTVLEGSIQEMTQGRDAAITERDEWQAKYNGELSARLGADLNVYATEHVAEMASAEGANKKLIDLASARTTAQLVDGDLETSKASYRDALKGTLDEMTELAEMFSAPESTDVSDQPTRQHTTNPKVKESSFGLDSILSPELVKVRKDRADA